MTSCLRKVSAETPLRPTTAKEGSAPSLRTLAAVRMPSRMMLELKAPARPRSPVTRTIPTRLTFSRSTITGTRGMPPACSAAWRVSLRIPSA